MNEQEILEATAESIIAADEEKAVELARQALDMGLDPNRVIAQGFSEGMKQVGDLFERGQRSLPEVIIASEAMVAAVDILSEALPEDSQSKKVGVALLGTIEGDVHDIGKGIVATLLRVYGFQVHDLGRDVPLDDFVAKAKEVDADIVGSSALMTTTMLGQKALEQKLRDAGVRDGIRTMVGGAVVTQYWADKIGADAYAEDAQEAVTKALELVEG